MSAPEGLSTLVHFYNDERYLFVTVTMYTGEARDRALDSIVRNRAWFGGRYAPSERGAYLSCRETVDRLMYAEFERKYWKPPTATPVFFYIYPRLDSERLRAHIEERAKAQGHNTKVVTLKLHELSHIRSMSFTVEDSHQSYREVLADMGITVRGERAKGSRTEHNGKLYHISELEAVCAALGDRDGLYLEVQVWDPAGLELIKARLVRRAPDAAGLPEAGSAL